MTRLEITIRLYGFSYCLFDWERFRKWTAFYVGRWRLEQIHHVAFGQRLLRDIGVLDLANSHSH